VPAALHVNVLHASVLSAATVLPIRESLMYLEHFNQDPKYAPALLKVYLLFPNHYSFFRSSPPEVTSLFIGREVNFLLRSSNVGINNHP